MEYKKFATAINCIDGRTQFPVAELIKREFAVDYVDMVTESGPIKILAEQMDIKSIASIKKRVGVSVNQHLSRTVAVVAHFDCAGNPVGKDTQLKQLEAAVRAVEKWGLNVKVIGLWVDEDEKVTPSA